MPDAGYSPQRPAGSRTSGRRCALQLIPQAGLEALRADDLVAAGRTMGLELPAFFLGEGWLWDIRLDQLGRSPGDAPWLVRAALLEPDGLVVGHAGFHGPPDPSGMVEIGYTIVPEQRGKGYSRLVLAALLQQAAAAEGVTTVRASVSPHNTASLRILAAAGFIHVGEQWDDVDGTELILEKHVHPSHGADGP